MLVLSRRCGEKLHVGDDITITVVHVERGRVRLGIDAPRSVTVWRDELALSGGDPRPALPGMSRPADAGE